jgi:lysophospholipase L1-like esterase
LGAQYPERAFEFVNRGVSGDSVQKLAARWREDALDLAPDLLSLLIGVNNRIRNEGDAGSPPFQEALGCYRGLLEDMRSAYPGVRFLILEPFLLEAGDITPAMKELFQPLQQGISEIAAEFAATFVPLQAVFDRTLSLAPAAYWAYDGIHATHAGFQLIADAWLGAANSHGLLAASQSPSR